MNKPEIIYMNNTKIIKRLIESSPLDTNGSYEVIVIPKKNTITKFTLTSVDTEDTFSIEINPFDIAVMDSIYTIVLNGYERFTPQDIYRVMSCNKRQEVTSQKLARVKESIRKLSSFYIEIDCTDEFLHRKIIDKDESMIFSSKLLPVKEAAVKAGNQKIMPGYVLIEEPALYEYASSIKQIVSVPHELFEHSKLSDTDEIVILKRYLIKRIALMKNTNNNMLSNKISYEWGPKKEGMFKELGFRKEDFSNWPAKKTKIHKHVRVILEELQEKGYVKGFKENQKNGYEIHY